MYIFDVIQAEFQNIRTTDTMKYTPTILTFLYSAT
jgi:hypothetical protein